MRLSPKHQLFLSAALYFFYIFFQAHIDIFYILLILLFFSGFVLLPYIIETIKEKKIENRDWKEDMRDGAIDEPRPTRDLTDTEVAILTDEYKQYKILYTYLPLIIVLSILADSIFIWITITGSSNVSLSLLIYGIIGETFLITYALKDKNAYLDLESPVFRVAGEVLKREERGKYSTNYYITVRKLEFSDKDFSDLSNIFDRIQDNQPAIVEYSPRTKHVWSFNIENLNRGEA